MDILFIMSEALKYPHPPDLNQDYGEPGRIDSTCAECEQVWLKEDLDDMGRCIECRPVEDLDDADREWWDSMTMGCEKSHREREEKVIK